ncbi:GNAT family protein [Paenibacillus sp. Marseille-Q4541]|uniref:GNAT family N-acetyltransferase n=1 Tax=Paenibacillus sp. Marseille-Q4541 TaxID=2831522 RepID=UPI001BA48DE3|nr:GNAT family protein [Paenibacillus sp. Marseille-Q4541]
MATVRLQSDDVVLRTIEEADIEELYHLLYGEANPEWKKWDAPYYPLERESRESFRESVQKVSSKEVSSWIIIEVNGLIVGTVSYYIEDSLSMWIETGIVMYRSGNWNKGIGTKAMKLWIAYLFQALPIVRIGITTWSGNVRMMNVGTKLGMQIEGRMRKCRVVDGVYYDSIRMGMLREEWEQHEL